MELEALQMILDRVHGATFATLNTTTTPLPGLKKITTGVRVLLFSNTGISGYEQMVKRRLKEAGKDPNDFVLGDLPWGERVGNTPIISYHGYYYLQTIVLSPGESHCYAGNIEVDINDFIAPRRTNQGLSKEDEVIVSTYRLDHIDRIQLMGEIIVGNSEGLVPL